MHEDVKILYGKGAVLAGYLRMLGWAVLLLAMYGASAALMVWMIVAVLNFVVGGTTGK